MSYTPIYIPNPDTYGRPAIFKHVVIGADSEDITLWDVDEWFIITFLSGVLQCDAGPTEWGCELDSKLLFANNGQNNASFPLLPIQMAVCWVVQQNSTFQVHTGFMPSGGTTFTLSLYVGGYRIGNPV